MTNQFKILNTLRLKHLSLSSLSKNTSKNDAKVPTQKNVSDLKNALASIIGAQAQKSEPAVKPIEHTVSSIYTAPPVHTTQHTAQNAPQKEVPVPQAQVKIEEKKEERREVSREILEKMLRVEE